MPRETKFLTAIPFAVPPTAKKGHEHSLLGLRPPVHVLQMRSVHDVLSHLYAGKQSNLVESRHSLF